jgi:anhydro-N-acetylmuramic acid kinase
MRVIGLMSGTSYDAIDAAAADLSIEGASVTLIPLGVLRQPYSEELRAAVAAAMPPKNTTMEHVCRLDTLIGQAFATLAGEANDRLCDGAGDLIVSHGQTMFHWVDDGQVKGSLQLGQPAWIAEYTGLPVVADLRSRDIAAGGQGAPLVSLFDVLWLGSRPGCPVALNLGGIANITVMPGDREPIAFDTGPANALIDAGTRHVTGGRLGYDVNGALAARGVIDHRLMQRLLAEPYYSLPGPKSTGKELFNLPYLLTALEGLEPRSAEDLVATLTALTARTVADAVIRSGGTEVIAAGGGTNNPVLMRMLASELARIELLSTTSLGLAPCAKEAYAFATLGFLTAQGLFGSVASCTGARHASILGSLTPGRGPLTFPRAPTANPVRLRIAASG